MSIAITQKLKLQTYKIRDSLIWNKHENEIREDVILNCKTTSGYCFLIRLTMHVDTKNRK